jgi:cell growth-regulating nucleolar protein
MLMPPLSPNDAMIVIAYADDYRTHTSCMTESERYEKKGPSAKSAGKVTPQQHWMNAIASAVDSAPAHLRNYVLTMSQLDNVPRKEKQFRNFTANSLNLRGNQRDAIVSDIWNLLKAENEKRKSAVADPSSSEEPPASSECSTSNHQLSNESNSKASESSKASLDAEQSVSNGSAQPSDVDTESPNGKKAKDSPASKAKAKKPEAVASASTKKTVKKAIRGLLKKSREGAMTFKALRKAVREQLRLPKNDAKQYVADIVNKSSKRGSSSFEIVQDGKAVRLKA